MRSLRRDFRLRLIFARFCTCFEYRLVGIVTRVERCFCFEKNGFDHGKIIFSNDLSVPRKPDKVYYKAPNPVCHSSNCLPAAVSRRLYPWLVCRASSAIFGGPSLTRRNSCCFGVKIGPTSPFKKISTSISALTVRFLTFKCDVM
jgi:hypothetical protein